MPYMEIPDEIPIHYLDEGPRVDSCIFLIHGEPFSCQSWQKNIPDLAQGFRVIAMDVRGRGLSGKTSVGHVISQFSYDVQYMIETLGLERVVVVGWSLGSCIVWSHMNQFDDQRIVGHVNVDQPPCWSLSEEDFRRRIDAIQTNRLSFHHQLVRSYLGPEARESEAVVNGMVYECMQTPTTAYVSAATDSFYSDYRAFLSNVRVPTLIFWARYGNIQPDMAKFMDEAIPDARLVFFDHSGHFLPWTESAKFNRELSEFARDMLKA